MRKLGSLGEVSSVVSCSSAKDEYMSWLLHLVSVCGFNTSYKSFTFDVQLSMTMYCENEATIHIAT